MTTDHSDDRTGIFSGDNPFDLTRMWLDCARESEPNDPEAIALATADSNGLPDVRMVLLKEIEASAFVFYTNFESAKGQQLDRSGQAAFLFHWKSLRRQIRVRGIVERAEGEKADRYFESRHPESRLGAWASRQSRPLTSRQELMDRAKEARDTHGDNPPRPPYWGGYRLVPSEFEFWADGEFRLHNRFRWVLNKDRNWEIYRLSP